MTTEPAGHPTAEHGRRDAQNDPMIRLEGVTIGYDRPLLGPVELDIGQGDFWGIVGPNGAGKTTLVRTIAGLMPALSGTVRFPETRPRFGYVPQRHVLDDQYPLTGFDVVAMGRTGMMRPGRRLSLSDRERTTAEIDRAGLADQAGKRFASLSGGQQQRLLAARALATDPDVLILDEPTAGMDIAGEADFLSFLSSIRHRMTILMIGHHIDKVVSVASHICLINLEHGMFEAGPVETILTDKRLSAAYDKTIHVDRCGKDLIVHVTGGADD